MRRLTLLLGTLFITEAHSSSYIFKIATATYRRKTPLVSHYPSIESVLPIRNGGKL